MGGFSFPGNRSRAVARAPLAGIAAIGLACLLWVPPAHGDLGFNAFSRQPVCVDGVPAEQGEIGLDTLSFVVGSLLDGMGDPFANSRAAYAIRQDGDDPQMPYGLYVSFELGLRTRSFGREERIGKFTFPTRVNGVPRPNFTVWLFAFGGNCRAFFDLDGNGSIEGQGATLGIKAGISFGSGAFSPPNHLRGELFLPLNAPAGFFSFLPTGQAGIFPVPGPTLLIGCLATDQSSTPVPANRALITFVGSGNTTSNSDDLPIRALIDVKPGISPNIIGKVDLGVLTVAILTTLPRLDARNVNVNSLRLRDPNLAVPGAQIWPNSAYTSDVNGDGKLDLVVRFKDVGGSMNASTTALQVTGMLSNGRSFEGQDAVVSRL